MRAEWLQSNIDSPAEQLRIVPATLTKDFFTATLRPGRTLGFFYEALDKAFEQVEADYGSDVQVAILGHSIGGWVARSYIGEVMGAEVAAKKICSLVTLGTPHNPPPPDSPVAALDQTRGLLTYINEQFPSGSPLPKAAVTCVAGKGTKSPASISALLRDAKANVWDENARRSLLVEQVVALSSYFPLSGKAFDTVVRTTQTALRPFRFSSSLPPPEPYRGPPSLWRALAVWKRQSGH